MKQVEIAAEIQNRGRLWRNTTPSFCSLMRAWANYVRAAPTLDEAERRLTKYVREVLAVEVEGIGKNVERLGTELEHL